MAIVFKSTKENSWLQFGQYGEAGFTMANITYVNGVGFFETKDGAKAGLIYRLLVSRSKSGAIANGTAIFETDRPDIGESLLVTNDHGETFECLVKEIKNGNYYIVVNGQIPRH